MAGCFACKGTLNNNQCTTCGQDWEKCDSCEEMSVKTVMETTIGSSYDEVLKCQNRECDSSDM